MSLNWNLSNVKDEHVLHNVDRPKRGLEAPFPKDSPEDIEGNRQWVITDSLIWRTMLIDIGHIKETNYVEAYRRLMIVDRILGKPFYMDGEEATFTLADIKRRIGMTTNVLTVASTKWEKRALSWIADDAAKAVANEVIKMAEAEGADALDAAARKSLHNREYRLMKKPKEKAA